MSQTSLAPEVSIEEKLEQANLRKTCQRLLIGSYIFTEKHRHITAEQLYEEIVQDNHKLSLATIYNTLNNFTEAGLLKQVPLDAGRLYFDTNTEEHHHYFLEEENKLLDIDSDRVTVKLDDKNPSLVLPPEGTEVTAVNVTIHLRTKKRPH